MPRLTARDLLELTLELIGELSRADLERTALLVVELALDQANRLGRTSDTSSQPPSTDDPYRRQERREQSRPEPIVVTATMASGRHFLLARRARKGRRARFRPRQAAGHARLFQPIVATGVVDHDPAHF